MIQIQIIGKDSLQFLQEVVARFQQLMSRKGPKEERPSKIYS